MKKIEKLTPEQEKYLPVFRKAALYIIAQTIHMPLMYCLPANMFAARMLNTHRRVFERWWINE